MRYRSAVRNFQKVVETCPECGDRDPKELVEGESRPISIPALVIVIIISVFTCGLGLFLLPAIKPPRQVLAHCAKCNHTFPYSD